MTPTKDRTATLDELVQRYGTPEAQTELARLREKAEKVDEAEAAAALRILAEATAYRIGPTATPARAAVIQAAATKQTAFENQRRALSGKPALPAPKL